MKNNTARVLVLQSALIAGLFGVFAVSYTLTVCKEQKSAGRVCSLTRNWWGQSPTTKMEMRRNGGEASSVSSPEAAARLPGRQTSGTAES